ncbi:MAG: glutamate 5-kinase [Rhodospirillales bacterium]|nr:glutamate 5-kinase [Rhodospirillales bacterium]
MITIGRMKIQDLIENASRLVVKIGSALVTDAEKGILKADWLKSLAMDLSHLKGKEIIIVSSGAIALGRTTLGIDLKTPSRDLRIDQKQAAASVGQIRLMAGFIEAFGAAGLTVSQILLNSNDTENRRAHLNARATLGTLMKYGVIPVINENDTTATDEIRFGDNDKLAARVAQMMEADVLLILSTTEGLFTDNPQINPAAQHIPLVPQITQDVMGIAGDALHGVSTGGMKSKVEAAKIAVNAGTHVVITSGKELHSVRKMLADEQKLTLFTATETPHNARQKWIAAHLKPKGTVMIDDGAVRALKAGKSLLPVGVKEVIGTFDRGDGITLKTQAGASIGIGLSGYDHQDARKIAGKHSEDLAGILGYAGRDVLVHRNDLVLLKDENV